MERRKIQPLPLLQPEGNMKLDFMCGMQYHAPFLLTDKAFCSDLGHSVMCTFPPHYMFKIRGFKTSSASANPSEKEKQLCILREEKRMSYLKQRLAAFENGKKAVDNHRPLRKEVMAQGVNYDKELDEPRLVCKVPGLNIYLELVGCLDAVRPSEVDWYGEHGVIDTMGLLQEFAYNLWQPKARTAYASKSTDWQPLEAWQETYDPTVTPTFKAVQGLGISSFDPVRRKRYENKVRGFNYK